MAAFIKIMRKYDLMWFITLEMKAETVYIMEKVTTVRHKLRIEGKKVRLTRCNINYEEKLRIKVYNLQP